MKVTELIPVNNRKSFYGKALAIEENNVFKLKSYQTIVAEYDAKTKQLKINGWYSSTTQIHLNAFFCFLGLKQMNKQEILKMVNV